MPSLLQRAITLAIVGATVILVIEHCSTVHAQPADAQLPDVAGECRSEVPSAQLAQNGVNGMWFPMPLARCLLERITVLPLYAERVRLYGERLVLSDRLTAIVREQTVLAVREADLARGALEAAVRRAREAEEDRDRWYRSPTFLVCLGVVSTVLLEVAAVLILKEVN
jgi:hypothetical protein